MITLLLFLGAVTGIFFIAGSMQVYAEPHDEFDEPERYASRTPAIV